MSSPVDELLLNDRLGLAKKASRKHFYEPISPTIARVGRQPVTSSPLRSTRGGEVAPLSFWGKHGRILMWSLFAIVSNVGMMVSLKKIGFKMPDYPYVVLNFTCLCFNVPFFFVAYLNHFLNDTITPEMTRLRWKFHLSMQGLLTAMNGFFIVFSNPWVPGPLQTVLFQANIPIVIIFSVIFLKARFSWLQYSAALMVVGGVLITLIPSIKHHDLSGAEAKWITIFFLGSVPMALNYIYQEFTFRKQKLDIGYMMAWSNLSQWVWLLVLAPVDFIPGFGTTSSFSGLYREYSHGLDCFFGKAPESAHCNGAGYDLLAFVGFYCAANFANAALVKYGNAAFSLLVSAGCTILADICFASTFIMHHHATKLNRYDIGGLFVVLFGAMVFRLSGRNKQVEEEEEDDLFSVDQRPEASPFAPLF